MAAKKQVRRNITPATGKQPRVAVAPEIDDDHILWSFVLFDDCPNWREEGGKSSGFIWVAEHLKSSEGRTWGEIIANNHRDHPVPLDDLCREAQNRLWELKLDDTDPLWRLRFAGAARIWGRKDGPIFRVIWWDPCHRVCPSQK